MFKLSKKAASSQFVEFYRYSQNVGTLGNSRCLEFHLATFDGQVSWKSRDAQVTQAASLALTGQRTCTADVRFCLLNCVQVAFSKSTVWRCNTSRHMPVHRRKYAMQQPVNFKIKILQPVNVVQEIDSDGEPFSERYLLRRFIHEGGR